LADGFGDFGAELGFEAIFLGGVFGCDDGAPFTFGHIAIFHMKRKGCT
jgi:hypothetical protein